MRSSASLGHVVVVERQGEAVQLLAQLRGQAVFEFADRAFVDLLEPDPAGVVERRGPDLLQAAA